MARDYEINVWDAEAQRAWDNDPHTQEFNPEIEELLKRILPQNALILDAGCNIGKNIHAFEKLGFTVWGLEQSAKAVEYAKLTYPGRTFACQRIQEINLHEVFSLIFTSAVLQHSEHSKKPNILAIFYEALKPSGYYFFTENTLKPGTPTDGYSLTEAEWIKLVESIGFKHLGTWYPGPYYLFQKC